MLNPASVLIRLVDFHLAAFALLLVSIATSAVLQQPARRLTIAWTTALALVLLVMLTAVPQTRWPVLREPQAVPAGPSPYIFQPTTNGVDPIPLSVPSNAASLAVAAALDEGLDGQEMLRLAVRVVDEHGVPVTAAKVTPWALQSSQGHGWWRDEDKGSGASPESVLTDVNGTATILYPRYRYYDERVRTISVSLHVDHPEFAYLGFDLHIDVPLEEDTPYKIELKRGADVVIRSTIDGSPADLNDLFALWSDGRSWTSGVTPEKTVEGILRIPAMPAGKNSLLVVKLRGEHATHFSDVIDNMEAIYFLAMGYYLSGGADQSFLGPIETLWPPMIRDNANRPGRKFTWRFRETSMLVWFLAAQPGPEQASLREVNESEIARPDAASAVAIVGATLIDGRGGPV